MTIGLAVKTRILGLCKTRGITTNRLGTISGVTQSTIQNIVGGRNKGATVTTIKKLCDGLEISIIDFFNDDIFKDLEQEIR